MTLIDFKNLVGLDELTETNRAKYICFFLYKEDGITCFSPSIISNKLIEFGYSKPNSSRLKTNLIKEKIMKFTNANKTTLEFIPICIQQLEKDYGENWNDFETIESNSELLDEAKFCGKRGFLTKLIKQINISYKNNCYDGCAVLLRRVFEIVLVLCFQKFAIENQITKPDGSHLMLEGITKAAIGNTTLNISKRITDNFESFREVGNNSAHSITYTASKKDIDDIARNYRVMLEDLYNKAGLM
ncbi:MAG: hypothetical protein J6X11_01535 [Treponema sp.]|nr:hypothetical protein [Treponema sp.]